MQPFARDFATPASRHAKQFDWQKNASATLAVYERALGLISAPLRISLRQARGSAWQRYPQPANLNVQCGSYWRLWPKLQFAATPGAQARPQDSDAMRV